MRKLDAIKERKIRRIKVKDGTVYFIKNDDTPVKGSILKYGSELSIFYQTNNYLKGFRLFDKFFLTYECKNAIANSDDIWTMRYNYDFELLDKSKGFTVSQIDKSGEFRKSHGLNKLYYVENASKKVIWEVNHRIRNFHSDSRYLYCIGKLKQNDLENQLFCLDETQKILWKSSDFETKPIKAGLKIKLFMHSNYIFYADKKNILYKVNPKNGKTLKVWTFKNGPVVYNNKIGCLGLQHEELDLETMEYSTINLRTEFEKHFIRPFKIQDKNHISHGLGFVPVLKSHYLGDGVVKDELFLVAIDMATLQIVWKHQLKNTDWKQLEYDGNRIYLLGPSGTLTIFEKEN